MSLQQIPVQQTANQAFSVVLDERNVQITLRTTETGLYISVLSDGVPVVTGRRCLDRTNLIPAGGYLGMPNSLFFADLQGEADPDFAEFGTRFVLLYGDPAANGATVVPTRPAGATALPINEMALLYDGAASYNGEYYFGAT